MSNELPPSVNVPQLISEQSRALDLMLSGRNVFLTGKAGSGKTAVVRRFQELTPRNAVFLAPTGKIALSIGGSTIHRFFGIKPGFLPPEAAAPPDDLTFQLIRSSEVFVLEECSQIRADLFSKVEEILRLSAPLDMQLPFGGKQIIAVGDPFQLGPVVDDLQERTFLEYFYGGVFPFQTSAWEAAGFEPVPLETPHRQSDSPEYLAILNSIRTEGKPPAQITLPDAVERLNANVKFDAPPRDATTLTTTKTIADDINAARDAELGSEQYWFHGKITGSFDEENCPTLLDMPVRIGSHVMLQANKSAFEGGYEFVNGDTGTVIAVHPDIPALEVVLKNGRPVYVEPYTWLNRHYTVETNPYTGGPVVKQKVIGSFTQVPVRLAYALTIHKAQGTTLEAAHIELGRGTFGSGQLYTALSRSRSMAQLSLNRPVHLADVRIDPQVYEFYRSLLRPFVPLPWGAEGDDDIALF